MIFILTWLFLTCVTSRPGRDVSGLEVEEEKTSKFPVGVAAEANSGVSPKPLQSSQISLPFMKPVGSWDSSHPCKMGKLCKGSVGEESRGWQFFFPKPVDLCRRSLLCNRDFLIIIYYSNIFGAWGQKWVFLAAPCAHLIPNTTSTFVGSPAMGSVQSWLTRDCESWKNKSLFGGCSSM